MQSSSSSKALGMSPRLNVYTYAIKVTSNNCFSFITDVSKLKPFDHIDNVSVYRESFEKRGSH